MNFRGTGIICDGNLKPTKSYSMRDGKKVAFLRFSMMCEDLTSRPVLNEKTGKEQRNRQFVQVVLADTEYGHNLFEKLSPGRLVMVEGRQKVSSSMSNNKVYVNIQVRMNTLQFMDAPIDKQIERICKMMVEASVMINGDVVTEESAAGLANQLMAHFDKKRDGEPVRKVVDNVGEPHKESNDPDQPDF